jgi:hypothetical protein
VTKSVQNLVNLASTQVSLQQQRSLIEAHAAKTTETKLRSDPAHACTLCKLAQPDFLSVFPSIVKRLKRKGPHPQLLLVRCHLPHNFKVCYFRHIQTQYIERVTDVAMSSGV